MASIIGSEIWEVVLWRDKSLKMACKIRLFFSNREPIFLHFTNSKSWEQEVVLVVKKLGFFDHDTWEVVNKLILALWVTPHIYNGK